MDWRPIHTLTRPAVGVLILYWCEGAYGGFPHVGSYVGRPDNATHWQPISKPS